MGLPGLYETILETSGLEVKQALEVSVSAREPPVFGTSALLQGGFKHNMTIASFWSI